MKWFGMISETKRAMVTTMLGKNLRSLQMDCNEKFSVKTTVLLASQLVSRLEVLHTKAHIVHRDIKPDNFVMGREDNAHLVYLIDFGESESFVSKDKHEHIPFRQTSDFVGSRRYASRYAQMGIGKYLPRVCSPIQIFFSVVNSSYIFD